VVAISADHPSNQLDVRPQQMMKCVVCNVKTLTILRADQMRSVIVFDLQYDIVVGNQPCTGIGDVQQRTQSK
jgi:hypothetical protein